jgi:AraC-like DNA-binding protein
MAYLTEWRLAMAADLLRDTRDSIEAVSRAGRLRQPVAFSTAFKRSHGVTPRDFPNGSEVGARRA